MQSFVEVIKLGSFSEAAKILGLSRALISRHVTDLEKHLGVRLLTRTTRRITLTEAGAEHFNFCQQIIKEIEAQDSSLKRLQREPAGSLKNSCPQIAYYIGAGGRDRELRGGLSPSSYQSHAR
jgi:DNA-binding transcriptional LysR family regulator